MEQNRKTDKISAMQGKSSELYKKWTSDFNEKRYFEWQSIWFQAKEIIHRPDIHSVLEFGSGRNLTKAIIEHFGIRHLSVDVSDRFYPDIVSSIEEFSTDEKFDIVCAFEVLEHNPFEKFEGLLLKMKSFSKKYVYISLPFSGRWFSIQMNVNLPKVLTRKVFSFSMNRLRKKIKPIQEYMLREDKYNPHWWEVGDKKTPQKRVVQIIEKCGLELIESFHNPTFPYHLFFLLKVNNI